MVRKQSLVLFFPLLLASAVATAQAVPGPKKPPTAAPVAKPAPAQNAEERVAALTNNMTTALGLTPAQAEKVRVINANGVRNVEAARQRYKDNPAKLRGYIEDIGLARLDQLKEVLTSSQFTRYQQKREEKMGIPTVRSYQGTPPPGLGSNGRGGDE